MFFTLTTSSVGGLRSNTITAKELSLWLMSLQEQLDPLQVKEVVKIGSVGSEILSVLHNSCERFWLLTTTVHTNMIICIPAFSPGLSERGARPSNQHNKGWKATKSRVCLSVLSLCMISVLSVGLLLPNIFVELQQINILYPLSRHCSEQ